MASSKEVIKKLILDYVSDKHYVRNNTIQVYWDYRDHIEDFESLKEICNAGIEHFADTFDEAMYEFMYRNDWDLDQWSYIFQDLDFDNCVEDAFENGDITEEDYNYYKSLDYSDVRDIVQDNLNLDMDPNHFNCDVTMTLRFDGYYSENYLDSLISDSEDHEDFYTFDEEGGLLPTDNYYYVIIQTDAYKFYEIYKQYKANGKSLTGEIVLTNCDIAIGDEDDITATNKTVVLNKKMIRELDDMYAEIT